MKKYEVAYARMVQNILNNGEKKDCRNGFTKSIFGMNLEVDISDGTFPLIQGRKMYPAGILGEFAAFVRSPKHVNDFEKWGCNYWDLWADEDGGLNLDYNKAFHEQLPRVIEMLKTNPNDRRMVLSSWYPENLDKLSLPCCHYSYQFYVRDGKYLDMIWNQRSVDMMIGLPADIVLAAIWIIVLGNEVGYKPGRIHMNLGDCHVYAEHIKEAILYCQRVFEDPEESILFSDLEHQVPTVEYDLLVAKGTPMIEMNPSWFSFAYQSHQPIKFLLKE